MAFDVVIRAGARSDLRALYRYISALTGHRIAGAYVDRLVASCHRIATFPNGGKPRDDLGAGLRTLAFERRAVIVYRVEDNVVEIVALVHGGRALTRQVLQR